MRFFFNVLSLKRKLPIIEWKLLFFMILFMDVKLAVKVITLILAFILQPDFRFGFRLKESRLPVFYLAAPVIIFFNWLLFIDFSTNHTLVILTGIAFWILCILAVQQAKLFVERTDIQVLHNTILLFFAINIAMSLFNLSAILWEIGLRNPFRYQGQYQKYFINTGDHIKGITFDSSTTNALINSFGIIYFLLRKQYVWVIACMFCLILTASNFTNAILLFVFFLLFIFNSDRNQKSIMTICVCMLVVFMAKFSPQNDNYIFQTFKNAFSENRIPIIVPSKNIPIREKPDSILSPEERKEKFAILYLDSLERNRLGIPVNTGNAEANTVLAPARPEIPGDSIHTPTFQSKKDTTFFQRRIISYINVHAEKPLEATRKEEQLPGKLVAMKQSVMFMKEHPFKLILGDGAGNFSSKLAFRATGLGISGGYPQRFIYSSRNFSNNHFKLYADYFTRTLGSHSIINSPASVYDQLFTEYGIVGLGAFLLGYVWFFYRKTDRKGYALPIMLLLLAAFTVEYWFEQLSIVLLFELMMFIYIKEKNTTAVHE